MSFMPSLMASLESNPSWPSSPESSSIWAFPLPLPLLDLLRLLLGGLQAFLGQFDSLCGLVHTGRDMLAPDIVEIDAGSTCFLEGKTLVISLWDYALLSSCSRSAGRLASFFFMAAIA